jgi:hypothetical protein
LINVRRRFGVIRIQLVLVMTACPCIGPPTHQNSRVLIYIHLVIGISTHAELVDLS